MNQQRQLHSLFVGLANIVFSLIMFLLVLRFLFELFAANSAAPFVRWLYSITDSLLYPFRGIFSSQVVGGRFIFDITALVALVVYGLVLSLIIYLFNWLLNSGE